MVPSDDYTSLVVEYFCSFGDHIWSMTEEELVAQTVKHLVEDLKFITPDEVIGGFTIRAPRAYPSYVIGYEKPLARIKAFIDELEDADDERLKLNYDPAATWCRLSMPGLLGQIEVTPNRLALIQLNPTSPQLLMETFFKIQAMLVQEMKVKAIGFGD
mgnify:CR=1 FL=1